MKNKENQWKIQNYRKVPILQNSATERTFTVRMMKTPRFGRFVNLTETTRATKDGLDFPASHFFGLFNAATPRAFHIFISADIAILNSHHHRPTPPPIVGYGSITRPHIYGSRAQILLLFEKHITNEF